jgi:hypothetical protein
MQRKFQERWNSEGGVSTEGCDSSNAVEISAIVRAPFVTRAYASELLMLENALFTAVAIPEMELMSVSEIKVSSNAYSTRS